MRTTLLAMKELNPSTVTTAYGAVVGCFIVLFLIFGMFLVDDASGQAYAKQRYEDIKKEQEAQRHQDYIRSEQYVLDHDAVFTTYRMYSRMIVGSDNKPVEVIYDSHNKAICYVLPEDSTHREGWFKGLWIPNHVPDPYQVRSAVRVEPDGTRVHVQGPAWVYNYESLWQVFLHKVAPYATKDEFVAQNCRLWALAESGRLYPGAKYDIWLPMSVLYN